MGMALLMRVTVGVEVRVGIRVGLGERVRVRVGVRVVLGDSKTSKTVRPPRSATRARCRGLQCKKVWLMAAAAKVVAQLPPAATLQLAAYSAIGS